MTHDDDPSVREIISILRDCATDMRVDSERLKQATSVLRKWVSRHTTTPTYQDYCNGSDELSCKAFPLWPLNGSEVQVNNNEVPDEFTGIVRALGLFLATASEAADSDAKRGASLMFDFIERNGFFPRTTIE